MRQWLGVVAILGAVACGGDGTTDTDGGDTDTDTTPVDLCESVPTFDLSGADCDTIRNAYDQTTSAADLCNTDADCQALSARCDVNLSGGCWVAVNTCLDQSDIDEMANQWAPCDDDTRTGCPQGGCSTPPALTCDGGVCLFDLTTM